MIKLKGWVVINYKYIHPLPKYNKILNKKECDIIMNEFLIPANSKRQNLIMGFMRGIDAIILTVGVLVTVFLLVLFGDTDNTLLLIAICLPAIICGILVVPIPNYHNTLVGIQSILRFYRERRNYVWKGWCVYDEFKDK